MENKNVDDLIAMIDGFMAEGGGHMNVRVEEDGGVHRRRTYECPRRRRRRSPHRHRIFKNYYDELPGLRRRQHGLQSSYPV